nr:MAG TPA: hypothetical protein [Caudoviricetes sp.]
MYYCNSTMKPSRPAPGTTRKISNKIKRLARLVPGAMQKVQNFTLTPQEGI